MNNGLKALLLAASTIITCIIVSLGFQMAREAKQLGNHVVEELQDYRRAVEEQDLTKYDGVTVYGADVVNLMKKELKTEENGFRIVVMTGTKTVIYKTIEDVRKAQETEATEYIGPLEEYEGELRRDANEVIVELIFRRK